MKFISIITAILLFISCGKDDKIDKSENFMCTEVKYDEPFTIQLGDEVCLTNGNSFELKTIIPEFCPCFMLCETGGSFKLLLETTNTNGDSDLVQIIALPNLNSQLLFDGFNVSNVSAALNDPNVQECDSDNIDIEKVTITMSVSTI